MSTLLASPVAVEITIKGATYAVETIDAGFAGVAAVRVMKLVSGESYDVVLQHDGLVVCVCPDYVCRHEGKNTLCKHGRAALEHGLLVAPISGGSPVAEIPAPVAAEVRPVTAMDLKRAAYFRLNIPKPAPAPIVEAAPVVEESPALPVEVLARIEADQILKDEDLVPVAENSHEIIEHVEEDGTRAYFVDERTPSGTLVGSTVHYSREDARKSIPARRGAYQPTPEDWAEYAAWSRSLDGGCGMFELSPEERDLITHSVTDREYRELLQEAVEAEYDAFADCEECFA